MPLFATLFVYGSDNTPRWFVTGTGLQGSGSTFSGSLYSTTGPFFGASFNPTAVGNSVVASATTGLRKRTQQSMPAAKPYSGQSVRNGSGAMVSGRTPACSNSSIQARVYLRSQ